MLVHFVKFIHLLITLSLLGATSYCLILVTMKKLAGLPSQHQNTLRIFNKILLYLVFFAIVTGTLLIYPKHFTFQTPWIQAAYLLGTLFFLISIILFSRKWNKKIEWFLYLGLVGILLIVIHDAVTKTTFLF